jgi:hypothetical protein
LNIGISETDLHCPKRGPVELGDLNGKKNDIAV